MMIVTEKDKTKMNDRSLINYFRSTFGRIVSCDSEYRPRDGNLCDPVCFVYRDIDTEETWHCTSREDVLQLPFDPA